jgi:hypothetical protein
MPSVGSGGTAGSRGRLRLEDAERGLVVAGATTASYEFAAISRGGRPVELAVDADDPAERRHGVGLERVPVGLDELVGGRQPDRVGVLDDRDGRGGVSRWRSGTRVEVEEVVERGRPPRIWVASASVPLRWVVSR